MSFPPRSFIRYGQEPHIRTSALWSLWKITMECEERRLSTQIHFTRESLRDSRNEGGYRPGRLWARGAGWPPAAGKARAFAGVPGMERGVPPDDGYGELANAAALTQQISVRVRDPVSVPLQKSRRRPYGLRRSRCGDKRGVHYTRLCEQMVICIARTELLRQKQKHE